MINLPNKTHIASFDVDAQNCFTPVCPDELPVPEGDTIAEALNQQSGYARLRVGSKDAHPANPVWLADETHPQFSPVEGNNVDIRWASHAVVGSKGFELISGLPHPSKYDYFVWKGAERDMHPYGACYHDLAESMSTGVIEFLRQNNIKMVLVGGLATDYCVKTTALQLVKAGFETVVNLSACKGIAKDTTEAAINDMRNTGIIVVDTIDDAHQVV